MNWLKKLPKTRRANSGLEWHLWRKLPLIGIGCVIVMVMKGPGYVADGYRLSHSDAPRAQMETSEEAAGYRLPES